MRHDRPPNDPQRTGVLPALVLWALTLLVASACSPSYVLRAGWEEARLLSRRRPIEQVVHDTTTPPGLRNKLRLVQDARAHGERALGLDPGDSFTSYAAVPRDTLLLVVSAARPYRLQWKTWWFPVVGRVPYKGYFDFDEARATARRLRGGGWDVHVRPSAAFSTLGWLPDPLLSTTLSSDSVALVETVLHEITHTTYFAKGHADFNESFANFVGRAGAVDFFCRALPRDALCRTARGRWHDARLFGRFVSDLHDRLSELYDRDLPDSEMEQRKQVVLREAARRYREEVSPSFVAWSAEPLDPTRLDNAWVLSRYLYYRRLDDFERVRRASDGLREAVHAVLRAARGERAPWTGLDSLLSRLPATGELPGR